MRKPAAKSPRTTRATAMASAADPAADAMQPEAPPAEAPPAETRVACHPDTPTGPLLLVAGPDRPALPGFTLRAVDLSAATDDAALRAELAPALALIAPAAEAARARAFAEALGQPDLPVLPADSAATALPAALAARLTEAQRDAGQARRTSALLRRETEAVNRRLHAIERFMYSLGGPRLSQALSWPPLDQMAHAGAEGTLTQRLPIDSPGITAVDLWLPEAGEDAARALSVAIEDSEGHRHPLTLDEVSVGRDDGWLRFGSDEPLGGDRQDCRLVIDAAPEGLRLGLGLATPDPLFAVQGTAEPTDQVLALRVWRAVAGATLNAAGSGLSFGRGRAEGTIARRLMPADLPRPSLLASPRSATDHVSTAFWPKEDAILVHPSAKGPVCAMLQRAPLANLSRLSAVVHAARKDGPPLAFAIGVAPSGTITEDDWDEYLGPWTMLPPGGWGEVQSLHTRAPLPGRLCDIVLATAVTGGASNNNAWALFRAFRAVWKHEA